MGQAEFKPATCTPAEYFALEAQSEVRHEYFDGEVYARAGGSKAHGDIIVNVVWHFKQCLRGQRCQAHGDGVKLVVQENFDYVYPDAVVSCDPADRRDSHLVRHPVLIVEVLSPSTADYDRTTKFSRYQQLPSLRHYLLISQAAWSVEWFARTETGAWVYAFWNQPDDVLDIPDVGLRVPLAAIYEDTGVPPMWVGPPPTNEIV